MNAENKHIDKMSEEDKKVIILSMEYNILQKQKIIDKLIKEDQEKQKIIDKLSKENTEIIENLIEILKTLTNKTK